MTKLSDVTVVAMGGNSLIDKSLPPTVENQFAVTARAVAPIAELLTRGVDLVLTHGNGPQVGFMQLRSMLARAEVHEVPLDSLVADSQGSLGYMIQRDLREQLRLQNCDRDVITIVTEVRVDPDDPALLQPRKPVGKFYSEEEALEFQRERGWTMVEDAGRGYRRVVPSPMPLEIVQLRTIRKLAGMGITVIACGGGGIPVVREPSGRTAGLEGVIDKDRTSAMLATELGVRRMIITTGVDAIYNDYLSDYREAFDQITVSKLRELEEKGQFPPGSMGPKVEAAISFLENGGEEVVICLPGALAEAYDGRAGTKIHRDA
jgi:carbamate kinase